MTAAPGLSRCAASIRSEAAEAIHRDRYLAGELLYIAEVDPHSFVDVIVDNTDFDNPRIVRRPPP
jgi:hypothetical protein